MSQTNLRDHVFSSRMAAGNFLRGSGFREESPDRWVSRDATAKVEVDGQKVRVKIRRRHVANRLV